MSTTTMTSQQRVNAMFDRRDHDRIPRDESFWADTIQRWQQEGLGGEAQTRGAGMANQQTGAARVLEMLDHDFHGVGGGWAVPFPGHHEVIREDEQTITYVNDWGETVKYWKHRSGTPEHENWGCATPDDWQQTYKPALERYDPNVDLDAVRRRDAEGRRRQRWNYLTVLESFEALRHLCGDVGSMIAMAENPDWVREMSRVYTDASIRRLDAHMAAGIEPDGLWCYGDMAYNHATMCSPRMYREIIWPDHKRLADWAHERGMKFIYHTDGDVNGVIDLYLEAGFDCLQPLEAKAHMDVRELCPKYGDRLAFFGNIDVMTMATNDLEQIEAEIVSKFAAGKATRGYAYHSDHSVPPSVSWATYKGIIELVEKHGRYE